MFDIGWSELLIIGVVALIAIGPKELPGVLRAVGHWVTKIRRMAGEFQNQFQEAMREAEMADIQKQVNELNDAARGFTRFDPLADLDANKQTGAAAASAGAAPIATEASSPGPIGDGAIGVPAAETIPAGGEGASVPSPSGPPGQAEVTSDPVHAAPLADAAPQAAPAAETGGGRAA